MDDADDGIVIKKVKNEQHVARSQTVYKLAQIDPPMAFLLHKSTQIIMNFPASA